MKTKSTVFKNRCLRLPEIVVKKMMERSKEIKGCPRPNVGSENHFAVYAILKVLKEEFGDNYKYLYPEYYQFAEEKFTSTNTGSLKCPHWYRSTDGVHVVVVDRCNNPNCEQWALQASRLEAGA